MNHDQYLQSLRTVFKTLEDQYEIPITEQIYKSLMAIYGDYKMAQSVKDQAVEMSIKLAKEVRRLEEENTHLKTILLTIVNNNPHLKELYEDLWR